MTHDRDSIERQLVSFALCDPRCHEVIPIETDFDRAIVNAICREIVESCVVGRDAGLDEGLTDLEWVNTVILSCEIDGFSRQRVEAYLSHSYRAPVSRVYLTTADAWAALLEVGE